ncbi:hypothetical protein AAFX24_00375 [Vibrio mediterranei]|uniref:hypothetical protein n=1 Tax=Vibrio mediterranei TaxID=689 RepID=UPI0038CE930C
MFEQLVKVSEELGTEKPHRTYPFFLQKLVEEVGELSVELQIKDGITPTEKGGSDGVVGEACDVINCAIDVAWRALHEQNPDQSSEEVARLIMDICLIKREKWLSKVEGM